VDVVQPTKRHRSSRNQSTTIVDVPRPTKRRRLSYKQQEEHVPRPTKHRQPPQQKETEQHVPRTTTTYKKDLTPTVSKTEQNTAFLDYLRTLGIPMKKLSVLVLDTSMLRTTRMLLTAGLMPSHIYIPQPDKVEAARMLEQYPTLRVFPGLKAGDLIWKMAGGGVRFHGALMDYCGMAGKTGTKNMPMDDVVNLFRYKLLQDQAVLTQTVCARSCVQVTEKYEGFKSLVKTVHNCARRSTQRVYKAKELIYTDPGSQTMCHYRCIVANQK
jgi:hypothetical protein